MTPDPQATFASDVDPDREVQGDVGVTGDMGVEGDIVQVEEILVEEVSIDGLCGVY